MWTSSPARPTPARRRTRTLFRMGVILAQMGKNAEARACFERALAVDPSYIPAQEGLKNVPAPEQPVMGPSNG